MPMKKRRDTSQHGSTTQERERDDQGRFIDQDSDRSSSSGRGQGSPIPNIGSERPRDEQGRFIDEDDRDSSKHRGGSHSGDMR